jgi:hypothetical protein
MGSFEYFNLAQKRTKYVDFKDNGIGIDLKRELRTEIFGLYQRFC